MLVFVLAASLALIVSAAPAADEVKSLPGWSSALPSKWYSGFIDAGNDTQDGINYQMKMWYVFVECETNPASAPVVLWTNGGKLIT